MEDFGLYTISTILSFLSETEGCSFLITNKKLSRLILPLFRIRKRQPMDDLKMIRVVGAPAAKAAIKNRHKFVVAPVHDAATRLDRLNTRRWKKRKLPCTEHQTTRALAHQEWKHSTAFPPLLQFSTDLQQDTFQPGITLLASYPRSGNTLLRSYLEGVTGIVTASDTRADRTLSIALAEKHDLVGEGLCLPPITKTHWPERRGCSKFRAHRAVLVVRNPFDAIVSFWNLNVTNTHTEKVTEEVYERFADFFQDLVRNEMVVWLEFLEFWATRTDIPVLLVRYEDLIGNPRLELEKVLNFYGQGSSDGTLTAAQLWKDRLDTVLENHGSHGYQKKRSQPQSAITPANPNESTGTKPNSSIGRSITKRYSPALLQEMHNLDRGGWLKRFGYHIYDQDFPNNLQNLPVLSQTNATPPTKINSQGKPITVLLNQPEVELRPPNSPFGRKMRDWRRKHTKDDTEPFPTVGAR